ncbi:hypothetical protein ABIE52_004705 [Rhodococcus sp. OAS809]
MPSPVYEDPGYGAGPVLDTENLLPAERKLLHAVRTSTICDPIPYESKLHNFEIAGRTFRTIKPPALEIAEWTSPERMIRGEILARLIRHGYSDGPVKNIELRGAIITGTLYFSDEIVSPAIELSHCRIENISAFLPNPLTISGFPVRPGCTHPSRTNRPPRRTGSFDRLRPQPTNWPGPTGTQLCLSPTSVDNEAPTHRNLSATSSFAERVRHPDSKRGLRSKRFEPATIGVASCVRRNRPLNRCCAPH